MKKSKLHLSDYGRDLINYLDSWIEVLENSTNEDQARFFEKVNQCIQTPIVNPIYKKSVYNPLIPKRSKIQTIHLLFFLRSMWPKEYVKIYNTLQHIKLEYTTDGTADLSKEFTYLFNEFVREYPEYFEVLSDTFAARIINPQT